MHAFNPLSGSVSNVCGWIFEDCKLTAFVLSLMLFLSSLEAGNAVLPSYLPALGMAYRGRDSLVQQYFDLGLNYVEIISLLHILVIHVQYFSLRIRPHTTGRPLYVLFLNNCLYERNRIYEGCE